MVGLGLYCTVGTLWDPTLTRSNMGIAMRALTAVWPALALSFGRVVVPIHGMDDPRYGFFSKGTYSPGLSLVPGFCADSRVAIFTFVTLHHVVAFATYLLIYIPARCIYSIAGFIINTAALSASHFMIATTDISIGLCDGLALRLLTPLRRFEFWIRRISLSHPWER